jgi:polysaccharide deacetylase family protein (PEP-CTERM system associated)
MKNALSIDLEYWYSAELVRPYVQDGPDLIVEMIMPLLNLLDIHKTTATFFVLGMVAEKYPELIREIYDRGHEIASHAYSHRTLADLGKDGFEYEIKKSMHLLEGIIGDKIKGFRAPTFSLNNDTIWGLEILEKFNFIYDSSVFPIRSSMYGIPNAPLCPYRPSCTNIAEDDESNRYKIIEIPLAVYRLGLINIPISGGFYLRSLPFTILNALIKRSMKNKINVIYLHPWEIFPIAPRAKLPFISRFITYHNIATTLDKLKNLLINYDFVTMEEIANDFN